MRIFNYNPYDRNVLVGESFADESQLEPGKFILPAYSTTNVPPSFGKGQRALYDTIKEVWKVESSTDPSVEENPFEGLSLEEAKAFKLAEFKKIKNLQEYSGFEFKGKIIDSDESSRTKILLAANQAATSEKFSIKWVTQDNSTLTLDAKGTLELASTLLDFLSTNQEKYASLKRKVASKKVKSIDDLDKITWD